MKNERPYNELFEASACLSLHGYRLLIAGDKSAPGFASAEAHLNDCELCQAAIAGIRLEASDIKVLSAVSKMQAKAAVVSEPKTRRNLTPFIAVAATLLLLIVIGNNLINKSREEKNERLFSQEMQPYPLEEKKTERFQKAESQEPEMDEQPREEDLPGLRDSIFENAPSGNNLSVKDQSFTANDSKNAPSATVQNQLKAENNKAIRQDLDAGLATTPAEQEDAADFGAAEETSAEKEMTGRLLQGNDVTISSRSSVNKEEPQRAVSINETRISSDKLESVTVESRKKKANDKAPTNAPEMNRGDYYTSVKVMAMDAYRRKEFARAALLFDQALAENPADSESRFYGAVSWLESNNAQKAEQMLSLILKNEKDEFFYQAEWYEALALIKLNRKKEAKPLLEKLRSEKGEFKNKAEKLLKELE